MQVPRHSGLQKQDVEDLKYTIENAIQNEMDLEMCRFRIDAIEAETNGELPLETIFNYICSVERKLTR